MWLHPALTMSLGSFGAWASWPGGPLLAGRGGCTHHLPLHEEHTGALSGGLLEPQKPVHPPRALEAAEVRHSPRHSHPVV